MLSNKILEWYFLLAERPSYHPTTSVKALIATFSAKTKCIVDGEKVVVVLN